MVSLFLGLGGVKLLQRIFPDPCTDKKPVGIHVMLNHP